MADTARPRIVIAGDVIDDVVVVPQAPIRPDTDTASTIVQRPGGSPANTAAWLGSLGADVDFVGLVGADGVERHTAALARHGVRAQLGAHPTAPTGAIVVLVDGERRAMLTERGANADFDPDAVTDGLLQGAAALVVTGHSMAGRTDAQAMRRLVSRARLAGAEVLVAPGSAGHIADVGAERVLTAFGGATVLIASLDEGRALAEVGGEGSVSAEAPEPEDVARALTRHAATVVLTLGRDGALVAVAADVEQERTGTAEPAARVVGRVPAVEAEMLDPTGAGDAFAAGFLHAWLTTEAADRDPLAAASAGAALAARAVTLLGARPA